MKDLIETQRAYNALVLESGDPYPVGTLIDTYDLEAAECGWRACFRGGGE